MRKFLIFAILIISAISCNDIPVGYLETESAEYVPSTMTVDVNNASQNAIDNEIPFVGTAMQGVLGTMPFSFKIGGIHSNNTEGVKQLEKVIYIRGNGVVEVPFKHGVLPGQYILDVIVSNEGHSVQLDSIFTVEIK